MGSKPVPSHSAPGHQEPQKSDSIRKQNATWRKCSGDAAAKMPHWRGDGGEAPVAANLGFLCNFFRPFRSCHGHWLEGGSGGQAGGVGVENSPVHSLAPTPVRSNAGEEIISDRLQVSPISLSVLPWSCSEPSGGRQQMCCALLRPRNTSVAPTCWGCGRHGWAGEGRPVGRALKVGGTVLWQCKGQKDTV